MRLRRSIECFTSTLTNVQLEERLTSIDGAPSVPYNFKISAVGGMTKVAAVLAAIGVAG